MSNGARPYGLDMGSKAANMVKQGTMAFFGLNRGSTERRAVFDLPIDEEDFLETQATLQAPKMLSTIRTHHPLLKKTLVKWIRIYQMASHSIGQAWRPEKGKAWRRVG